MTVQIGQVYRHPRYIRRVEITQCGPVSCTFKYTSMPAVTTTMRIADMQHWALIADICEECGEAYLVLEGCHCGGSKARSALDVEVQ